MKYAVVYSSRTGNTKELAQTIREALPGEECEYFGLPGGDSDLKASLVFAGFWTDKGSCDEEMAQWLQSLRCKQVFLFGTAGFGGSETYFDAILRRVGANLDDSNVLAGSFMCQGRMPEAVLLRYEAMREKSPMDEKIAGMIDNYHKAFPHPDSDDKQRLAEKIHALNRG